jgi:hypothetical protein
VYHSQRTQGEVDEAEPQLNIYARQGSWHNAYPTTRLHCEKTSNSQNLFQYTSYAALDIHGSLICPDVKVQYSWELGMISIFPYDLKWDIKILKQQT